MWMGFISLLPPGHSTRAFRDFGFYFLRVCCLLWLGFERSVSHGEADLSKVLIVGFDNSPYLVAKTSSLLYLVKNPMSKKRKHASLRKSFCWFPTASHWLKFIQSHWIHQGLNGPSAAWGQHQFRSYILLSPLLTEWWTAWGSNSQSQSCRQTNSHYDRFIFRKSLVSA